MARLSGSLLVEPRPETRGDFDGGHLPSLLTRLIGREEVQLALEQQLRLRRLVTIVGPAGIGKSTLALALARTLSSGYTHGCRFVDLVPVATAALVPNALAAVLGVALSGDRPEEDLARALKHKQMLLVFDNCEHVIGAAAALAEVLLKSVPGVSVLATSREPLRAEGEWVSRLATLTFPLAPKSLGAANALAFSAVELFVERALASNDLFELNDANAGAVADLCRSLDGIPLAIELAAARVDTFSLKELVAQLDDRLRFVMKGRRTALPRQQTLRGAMDWSYDALSDRQQLVLLALGVFPGTFDVAAVVAVLVDESVSASEVFDEVTELTAKSLVTVDVLRGRGWYRLLVTTRAYVLEKLSERGMLERLQRRHAEHTLERLRRISQASQSPLQGGGTDGTLDDMRAALQWAHSQSREATMAIDLTIAAIPLAAAFSLHDEFRSYVALALDMMKQSPTPDPTTEMRLTLALGSLSVHTHGPADSILAHARELWLKHYDFQQHNVAWGLQALEGVWASAFGAADYAGASEIAEQLAQRTAMVADPSIKRNGDRLLGLARHFAGDHAAARPLLQRTYEHFARPGSWVGFNPVQIDLRVSAGISLARLLWLQGEARQALEVAEDVMARAERSNHGPAICYALAFLGCPLSMWRGDAPEATRRAARLTQESTRQALGLWQGWARCYEASFDPTQARPAEWNEMQREMLCTLREDWVDLALQRRAESGAAGWCAPEILRAAGERLLSAKGSVAEVGALFQRSLALARAQKALFWELRATTSLVRLQRDHGQDGGAPRHLLEGVLSRFDPGVSSLDFERARVLLGEVS